MELVLNFSIRFLLFDLRSEILDTLTSPISGKILLTLICVLLFLCRSFISCTHIFVIDVVVAQDFDDFVFVLYFVPCLRSMLLVRNTNHNFIFNNLLI